jgi:chromosome segregation ATPase
MKAEKKTPTYLKESSSSGLFVGFVYVMVFISLLALAILLNYESSATKSSFNIVNERLLIIEEQINIADEVNNDSLTDISSSIQFLDKEVRKLWDLSNKRNKLNITKLIKVSEELKKSINEINKILDANNNLIKTNQSKILENQQAINVLNISNAEIETFKMSIKSIETQLMLIDDSVQALNNYKKQLNQSISEIQTEISQINQETIELSDQ